MMGGHMQQKQPQGAITLNEGQINGAEVPCTADHGGPTHQSKTPVGAAQKRNRCKSCDSTAGL